MSNPLKLTKSKTKVLMHCPRFEELEPSEEEKMEKKAWLGEYLTSVASFCYTDLQSIKIHGVKCFPPHYDILKKYAQWYHNCLVKLVRGV